MTRPLSLLFDVFVLSARVRELLSTALAGMPLRPDEYAVTSALADGGAGTTTALARLLGLPLATAHDYVRGLLARGLAERRRDPRDRRAWLLTLTPEGLAAHRTAGAAFQRAIGEVHRHPGLDPPAAHAVLDVLTEACAAAHDRLREQDTAATS